MSIDKEIPVEAAKSSRLSYIKKIDKINAGQLHRAERIEKALKDYDTRIEIKSLRDYIDLSKYQRSIIGELIDSAGSRRGAAEPLGECPVPAGGPAPTEAVCPAVSFIVEGLFDEPLSSLEGRAGAD